MNDYFIKEVDFDNDWYSLSKESFDVTPTFDEFKENLIQANARNFGFFLNEKMINYGDGKSGFGHSGLSANIVEMQKGFQKNLKYNKENKEQRMHLDQKQIALIQHLINDHHLYQDEYLDIDKENQQSIYLFKNIDQLSLLQENNILTIKPKK